VTVITSVVKADLAPETPPLPEAERPWPLSADTLPQLAAAVAVMLNVKSAMPLASFARRDVCVSSPGGMIFIPEPAPRLSVTALFGDVTLKPALLCAGLLDFTRSVSGTLEPRGKAREVTAALFDNKLTLGAVPPTWHVLQFGLSGEPLL